MEDNALNEMICRLLDLTAEIYELDRKITDFEKENHKFVPLEMEYERMGKMGKMYDVCKDYFFQKHND